MSAKKEIDFECDIWMNRGLLVHACWLVLTYCSIQSGFSVVFKSSIICFLIKASFLLVSFGIVMTLCRKRKKIRMRRVEDEGALHCGSIDRMSWRCTVLLLL